MSQENREAPSTNPASATSANRPPQLPLLQERGPAEHGHPVEQQHIGGAIEPGTGRHMRASSGKNDAGRSHHTGHHD